VDLSAKQRVRVRVFGLHIIVFTSIKNWCARDTVFCGFKQNRNRGGKKNSEPEKSTTDVTEFYRHTEVTSTCCIQLHIIVRNIHKYIYILSSRHNLIKYYLTAHNATVWYIVINGVHNAHRYVRATEFTG
jgi:hypothetical protein